MLQTRVGYAGGPESKPTYHQIGGHAEAVRVIVDPGVLSMEALLREYFRVARGGGGSFGQYRSEVFPTSQAQLELARRVAGSSGIPVAAPTVFWSAEDYHQKYRIRRNSDLVEKLASLLGPRWDEHAFATKLNGGRESDVRLAPWLDEMPTELAASYRRS